MDKVMLLIDADNVSLDVMDQAVGWVAKHFGGPHVRRAYCTAESAVKHQAAFKRLSIRPMVNLAAGKNSTDIALAVDAIDLALSERPDVVVIASSDSDFAPLVSRLREKGCRVIGIGQQGKTGEETRAVYDDYEVMTHHRGPARGRVDAGPSGPGGVAPAQRVAPPPAEVAGGPPKEGPKPRRRRSSGGARPGQPAASLPKLAPAVDPAPRPVVKTLPPSAPGGSHPEKPQGGRRRRRATEPSSP